MFEQIAKFYKALWGDSAQYRSIWYGKKGSPPIKQKWFTDTQKALKFATSISTSQQYNVYHACSLFDTKKRQQKHASEIRAFWLDLDIKDTECKTIKEMAKLYLPKLKDFYLGTNFWIIFTGHGIQLYWFLDEPLNHEEWLYHALNLREYCRENEIPIDNSRTKDSASQMRSLGSWNLKKDKIKKVKVIREGGTLSKKALPKIKSTVLTTSKDEFNKEDFNLNMAVSLNFAESDAHEIAKKCKLIKEFKETGLDDSEPLWHQALSVVVRCTDGVDLAHEFSSKSPRYNKDETTQKIERLLSLDIGPCLCSTFESLDDTYCKTCPLKQKLKSCIQLGATCTPIKDDLNDIVSKKQKKRAEAFMKCQPTDAWQVGDEGVYRYVDEVPVIVSRTPFYVIDKFSEDVNDETIITALIRAKTDIGMITFKLPLKWIAEDRKLLGEFNSRGIFPYNKKHFKEYLTTYLQNISHIKPVTAVNSLGWQKDDSFVYGAQGETYTKKANSVTKIIDSKANGYLKGFESKGSITKWGEAVDMLNDDDRFMPHLFSVLCALGSPFLPMTCAAGIVLSLQGVSGSGKTLAHRLAMSSWGNPQLAGSIGTKDSPISILARLAAVKNLPVRLDEATTLPVHVLSNLIYELVNGRGRARATIDGSLSNTGFEWQTLTLITTNKPLLEHSIIEITEAERYRILELAVEMPEGIGELGQKIFNIADENYGLAGKKIIEFMMHNKDYVNKTINYYIKTFRKHVDDSKRFWVSCYAAAFTAATIVKKLDLFTVDMPKLFKWALNILKNQTTVNNDYVKEVRGFDTKEELISSLYDSLAGHIECLDANNTVTDAPHKDIKARLKHISADKSIFYVRVTAVREFIQTNFNDSIQKVKQDLGIDEPKTIRLGKTTARMYVFNMEVNKDETII